jgi:UDP-N-acetyl-D-galactosamine dehydrogenase
MPSSPTHSDPKNLHFMTPVTYQDLASQKHKVCVIGLGYVGLPLAALLSSRFSVIGVDINGDRIEELKQGIDRTRELTPAQLQRCSILFTKDIAAISDSRLIIVTVPTPVDSHCIPDLTPLVNASTAVGKFIKPGSVVVYESTVYPGCTEEDCVPLIEKASGLKWKKDFFVGYSPERINPGDKEHTVEKIRKVVSGDSSETADLLRGVYGAVITAGIHVAASIKTAEAAKVIENTQRDVNIALMNELALIFGKMGLNTGRVLEAAGTKWNFLPFRPGLVGGHCIGVDPYYLTYKAQSFGYHPEVILAGRRINDGMGKYIAEKTVKKLIEAGCSVKGSRVLILGWTFKEDVPDVRNTRVIDIYKELIAYSVEVRAFDPNANTGEVFHEYGVSLIQDVRSEGPYHAVILAVKHQVFRDKYTVDVLRELGVGRSPVVIDVKGFFTEAILADSGLDWWQL